MCHSRSVLSHTLQEGHATVSLYLSQDSLRELALAFHQVGSRNVTRVIRLDGKHLYQPSHLAGSVVSLFNIS